MLVVSPLQLLMRDQVAFLTHSGTEAAIVSQSKSRDAEIKTGKVPLIYGSPEVLVGSSEWRTALQRSDLRQICGSCRR